MSPRAPDERAEETPAAAKPIPRAFLVAGVVAVVAIAVIVGRIYGVAVSALVLAAAALVGVVAFVFRTLQAIAEPPDDDILADHSQPTDADARKLAALRALKDIDYEHSLGNLTDEDHAELSVRYRAEAKKAMRAVDEERKERRARAEALAAEEVARLEAEEERRIERQEDADEEEAGEQETDESAAADEAPKVDETPKKAAKSTSAKDEKKTCRECALENDPDARFCKSCGGALTGATE